MAKVNRWFLLVSGKRPFSEAARTALAKRLKCVDRYLRLAAKQADEDTEYVHQLRVGSRRMVAALDVFGEVLPPKKTKILRRRLKQIRCCAGTARDCDVFIERLQNGHCSAPVSNRAGLLEYLDDLREAAQLPLVEMFAELAHEDFCDGCREFLKKIRWRGEGKEPTYRDRALSALPELLDDFRNSARADLSVTENLHQLRIDGKQLRYGLELMAGALKMGSLKRIYARLAEHQKELGEIVDHMAAVEQYEKLAQGDLSSELAADFHQLSRWEQERQKELTENFLSRSEGDPLKDWEKHIDRLLRSR